MIRFVRGAACAVMVLATPLFGQGGPPGTPPGAGTQQPMQPIRQLEEMARVHEQLMQQLHQTNQWMMKQGAQEHFRQMGQMMERAGDQVRDMLRQMERLHAAPDLLRDQDRVRDMDRLRDQLRDMTRSLDAAHEALRRMIHKP